MAPPERRKPFDHQTGQNAEGLGFVPPEPPVTGYELARAPRPPKLPPVDQMTPKQALAALTAEAQERGEYDPPKAVPVVQKPIINERQDPYVVMDRWDDEAIVHELAGQGPKGKLVYSFRQQGKDVVGLGKEGVDFCCQLLLQQGQVIRELELDYTLVGEGTEREALFKAKAGRFAVGTASELALDTVIGSKRQPLYNLIRATGEWVLNPHWYEQGSQKALRNARLRLLPIALREYVMAQARGTDREQNNRQQRKTDERREPSSDEQRQLYAQMLQSHHVKVEEREKATAWLAEKRHSKASMQNAIDALANLLQTRIESEKRDAMGQPS